MADPSRGTVTQLLLDWRGGDEQALDRLMPIVYDELRGMAGKLMQGERSGHTLQATALVHEAYARLVAADLSVQDRAHFLNLAAQAMRRILVDHARARRREKRGGDAVRVTLEETALVSADPSVDLVDIDDALRQLEQLDARKCRVVELSVFGGLTQDEIAQVLEVSLGTVERDLRMARAWLRTELRQPDA